MMDVAVLKHLIIWCFLWEIVLCQEPNAPTILAVLSSSDGSIRNPAGTLVLFADVAQDITLVGSNLTATSKVTFTTNPDTHKDSACDDFDKTDAFQVKGQGVYGRTTINLPIFSSQSTYYMCTKNENHATGTHQWYHQGNATYLRINVRQVEEKTSLLPLPLQICMIVLLLTLSGLFSGLNLGLMALDKTELQIIEKVGTKNEKKYAKTISPVRRRGNFLLCTLLLGNVLVNNSLTILLDNLSNGLYAVIGATLGIVIFGEIVPQAICSRHGLAVGAKTINITRLFMIITFPLSFPISLILDKVLGEEMGHVYDREKLRELVRVTKDYNDLQGEEVDIIQGALELTRKTAADIMTKVEDVYMLEIHSVLDFETVSEIMRKGYTRIPVYDTDRSNICAILNTKDLALIDPDDKTSLQTVTKFYQHPLLFVFEDQKLDTLLQDFRQGHSHMAIVRRVNSEGEGDPFYETMGVVTLEDVIEEIIQREILDETDILTDNRQKEPRKKLNRQDFSVFNQPDDLNRPTISPQLSLAAFRFLSTTVEAFSEEMVSEHVLKRLLKQNIIEMVSPSPHKEDNEDCKIYRSGIACNYFVLILQGQVEVYIGKEELCFTGGPFTFYGCKALCVPDSVVQPFSSTDLHEVKVDPYIPDFTVIAVNHVLLMRIRREHYIAARRATLMGRSKYRMSNAEDETFNREWKRFGLVHDVGRSEVNEEILNILTNSSQRADYHVAGNNNADRQEIPSIAIDMSLTVNGDNDSGQIKPESISVVIGNSDQVSTSPGKSPQNDAEVKDTNEDGESMEEEEQKQNTNAGEQDKLLSR